MNNTQRNMTRMRGEVHFNICKEIKGKIRQLTLERAGIEISINNS